MRCVRLRALADRDQPRLTRQRERAFVTSRVHFTDRGECVVLVADEQQISPCALRIGRDLRDALEYRALKVQLQHDSQNPGQARIHSDGKVQRQHFAALE